MKKILISCLLILSSVFYLQAQNETDVLRYSMLTFGGSARSLGAAGAFGALGADFSTLSTNPAGIGLYRKSEFTFSPSFYGAKTESSYNGTAVSDDKYNFNFSNAGVVFSFDNSDNNLSYWKYVQLGFGVNRMANFNLSSDIEGPNTQNSIITLFQDKAKGTMPGSLSPFDTQLAWDTYLLLDTMRDNNGVLNYTSSVPEGGVTQRSLIESRGSINEMVISLGGNFNDKLYLGGTVGFPTINYRQETTYQEWDSGDSIANFQNLSIYDNLDVHGTGVNFKFGMIYRPVNFLRIGGAVHTPTFYTMREEYSRSMVKTEENGQKRYADSPDGRFEYNLQTPMRALASIAFVSKMGFIGIDYEFVDYTEGSLSAPHDNFSDVKTAMEDKYKAASNLRVGGELNLNPIRLRAGYALYGNPYQDGVNELQKTSYTIGIGFRELSYHLDFAYVLTQYNEDYYLYDPSLVYLNPAELDRSIGSFVMSLSFKF